MEEQLVTFETAKLAKEIGFKEKCYATYYDYPNMYKRESPEKLKERNLDKVGLCFNISEIWIHPSERRNNFIGCDPPEHYIRYIKYNSHLENNNISKTDSVKKHWYSAPTQSLLQKWLREKHNIHIVVDHYKSNKYSCRISDECDTSIGVNLFGDLFNTYEEALEAGLFGALKLIKTK